MGITYCPHYYIMIYTFTSGSASALFFTLHTYSFRNIRAENAIENVRRIMSFLSYSVFGTFDYGTALEIYLFNLYSTTLRPSMWIKVCRLRKTQRLYTPPLIVFLR